MKRDFFFIFFPRFLSDRQFLNNVYILLHKDIIRNLLYTRDKFGKKMHEVLYILIFAAFISQTIPDMRLPDFVREVNYICAGARRLLRK